MPKEYTIAALTNRNKPDKFGNQTFMVKFAEDERSAYASFKTEPNIGDKKYGEISDGEYGARFKSAQRPEFAGSTPSQSSFTPPQAAQNKPHQYEDRSKEIIWSICVKEAASYVSKENSELSSSKFAGAVSEYANALFEKVLKPKHEMVAEALGGDVILTDDQIDHVFDDVVPFN